MQTPTQATKLKLVSRPVIPVAVPPVDRRFDWLLPVLIVLGLVSMIALPIAAVIVLRSAKAAAQWVTASASPSAGAAAQSSDGAVVVTLRTFAFFLACFGGWGFILYLWSCCVFSLSRGRSWTLGLLSLPALSAFVCLAMFGTPAMGLLGLLGVGGFLVPLMLRADPAVLAARQSVSATSLMARLASHSTWIAALFLFAGASLAYGNSFAGGMTLDNKYIIEEYFHALPRMIPQIDLYAWKTMVPLFFQNDYWWPKGISGLYRPVAVWSYWLNYSTNHAMGNEPLDPFQFHVVNFFLHWFAAYLGFILIRQLTGRAWIAFFAALLFVTHPIATESVSNIIGRSDILAAITVFACLSLYIRGTRIKKWSIVPWIVLFVGAEAIVAAAIYIAYQLGGPRPLQYTLAAAAVVVPVVGFFVTMLARTYGWKSAPWLGAVIAVLAVGLFSKESAIAVIGAIVMYDVIYRWTLEEFRCAVPSLLLFSVLAALAAIGCLYIGQFGALGLSEGLTPVLVILLVGALIAAGALVVAWTFWAAGKPLGTAQLFSPWTKYFLPYLVTAIPPTVLWLWARGYVFANASPPETPFLDNPIRGLGFFAGRITASDVFVRLLGLLVLPAKLSADYSFNQIPLFTGNPASAETWLALFGVVTVLGVLLLIAITYRRQKLICFLLVFYLIAYLPTSNFLIVIGSIMAERFLYLPLLAFVALVVLGVDWLGKKVLERDHAAQAGASFLRTAVVGAVMIALTLGYSIRARFRNDDWLTDITLWTSAAKNSPMSFRSYQSLAFALYEQYQGRETSGFYKSHPDQRTPDIDILYQTAEHAKPIVDVLPSAQNSSRLYLHLGMYYSVKGISVGQFAPNGTALPDDPSRQWFRRAERVLQEGVVIDRVFDGINRGKEIARKKFHDASEVADVGLPPVYSCLGTAYSRLGEWDKALQAFIYQRHIEPTDADSYVSVATAYSNQGRVEAEAVALLQALILDGKRAQLWEALAHVFPQIDNTDQPALTPMTDGRVQLHTEIPEVRSVLCSAYQGLVRIFLLARRGLIAQSFRDAAINQWKFPEGLFDNLVSDPTVESPVPPPPD